MTKQDTINILTKKIKELEWERTEWRQMYMATIKHRHIFGMGDDAACFLCGRTPEDLRRSMPFTHRLAAKRNRQRRRECPDAGKV